MSRDDYLTAGLEGVQPLLYREISCFTSAVDLHTRELRAGSKDLGQYVMFKAVTQIHFTTLSTVRRTGYKGLRFMYLMDEEILIVKVMPEAYQEIVSRTFGHLLYRKVMGMGLDGALLNIGSTTFEGMSSRKEADTAFKPRQARSGRGAWPTVVLECGIAMSSKRLRAEAQWWLEVSAGEVKIVLLFLISKTEKVIHIEQWERDEPKPELLKVHPTMRAKPTRVCTVSIVGGKATGAPLMLDFNKIFLRKPGKGESNLVFTAEDLTACATQVWDEV